jgi:hypothetical protein
MTDSLVLGGVIELLGGGVASTHPQALGALFRLGTGFDLSAPQMTAEQTAGLLLDGEVVTGIRASNRTPTIPVVIGVDSTGDIAADRLTLAGARELLLQVTSQESWQMVWTREGGEPLIFDCMGLSNVVVHYSVRTEQSLFSLVDVTFQAFPYARSDEPETIVFNAPAQVWPQPPSNVTIDDFTVAYSFLVGDNSGFEGGLGDWVTATNCVVVQSGTQFRTGAFSMRLTASSAATMTAKSCTDATVDDDPVTGATGKGLPCNPGDTINIKAWFRAAVTGRSCNTGAQFFDSGGNAVGSPVFGSNVSDVTTSFTQVTAALVAPAGAAYAQARVQVQAPANAEQHYVDDVTLDRGQVYSQDTPRSWSRSSEAAEGSFSAYWSRRSHDDAVYDRVMLASSDISGRGKLNFWLGLATTSTNYSTWHKGDVHFSVTLTDGTGQTVKFGYKRLCRASALPLKPHWQFIGIHIPQLAQGFDYTTLSRYRIEIWNVWDSRAVPATGGAGKVALQASAYIGKIQAVPTSTGSVVTRSLWATLPGIIGTARAALSVQAAPGPSSFSTVAEFTTAGSNAWSAPAGLTKVDKAEAWAGGGGGGGNNNSPGTAGGGGGGGGEYAMEINVPVTALSSYPATVGAGGSGGSSGNPGNSGNDSFWSGQSGRQVRANGGHPGWAGDVWGGGKGGSGSSNYVHHDGGDGRQSNINNDDGNSGGGGGSSGGQSSAGNSAGGRGGANAVSGGGPGGDGGKFSSTPHNGQAPSVGPGGGGGGGADNVGGQSGGAGKVGKVRLTYGASGLLPLASLLVHVPAPNAPDAFNPVCPVGNGSDVPNGATEYVVPDIGNLNARFDGTYTMYLIAGTWNSPASSRDLSVQMRQYPYTGGTAITDTISRNSVVPNTDITNGYVDMGPLNLPYAQLSPGGLDSYFALTVTSSNTADRFLDVLFVDTQGQFILVNVPGASPWNNIWLDAPDADRNLGLILGSPNDRDQASSLLQYVERFSGGPLSVRPDHNNRVLFYAAQGCPAMTAFYTPNWWTERLA